MKPETERLRGELEDAVRRARELAARLDDAALMRRPSEQSWSVAECLDHLSATGELYVRRLRRVLEAATVRSDNPVEKPSFAGRMFLKIMEPPVRRMRVKIPTQKLAPREMPSRNELLQRFDQTHAQLIALLEESDAYDRTKLRVGTPASKLIKITFIDAFAVMASHARRHLWQAERAVR
ncbi:MAG TPA: DinB family protein [Thermoanaerobaculia bacterium]|jgi:uncharacterized damage-inducible protein DinB